MSEMKVEDCRLVFTEDHDIITDLLYWIERREREGAETMHLHACRRAFDRARKRVNYKSLYAKASDRAYSSTT